MPDENETEKTELDLSGAQLSVVAEDILREHQRPRAGRSGARTKQQLVIDQLVRQAHEAWVKGGRPKEFSRSKGARIRVRPEQVVNVEKAVRKAGTYLNLSIRFGLYVDEQGEAVTDEEGYCDIVFRASDPRPRKNAQ